MKRFILLGIILLAMTSTLKASGVCIVDAYQSIYFQLMSNVVKVTINDQIATVKTTQEFRNYTGMERVIKYAFPLHEEASATNIRWKLSGTWYTATINPSPQDTTLPGGGGGEPDPNLIAFMGETPLFFTLYDTIPADSSLIIELTYVQLLPYSFSVVDFFYPNDYSLMQSTALSLQELELKLYSQRQIENIMQVSPSWNGYIFNDVDSAGVFLQEWESPATENYHIKYELNAEELGLFSYSTFFPDSVITCDEYGNGFFTFIVEPDPNDSLYVIPKVFTLIIDRSGSMSGWTVNGTKMEQAKEAAIYIVNNLNEGDYFNIVDFSTTVAAFMPDHVPFNAQTQQAAIDYITPMGPTNLTNISGAFAEAIPDFANSDSTVANIIIFLTDGLPTTGLITTGEILNYIQELITYNEVTNLSIHSFGIGDDVNQQLLSQIASQNDGICRFLANEELLTAITEFYNMIRNPVLLNPQVAIDPPLIAEIYPQPLPDIYLGQQLVMTGRYAVPDSVTVTFSGSAFGLYQEYTYGVNLADTNIEQYQFLTKLWAKQKMENLYVLYFTYPQGSPEAEEIKNEIIDISICYNVISPFTSYSGGGGGVSILEKEPHQESSNALSQAYPNPFQDETMIKWVVEDNLQEMAEVKIYDNSGKLVVILYLSLNGPGEYEIWWDGRNGNGVEVGKGMYFYRIGFGNHQYSGKLFKI